MREKMWVLIFEKTAEKMSPKLLPYKVFLKRNPTKCKQEWQWWTLTNMWTSHVFVCAQYLAKFTRLKVVKETIVSSLLIIFPSINASCFSLQHCFSLLTRDTLWVVSYAYQISFEPMKEYQSLTIHGLIHDVRFLFCARLLKLNVSEKNRKVSPFIRKLISSSLWWSVFSIFQSISD